MKTVVIAELIDLKGGKKVIINSSTLYNDDKKLVMGMRSQWYRYDPIGLNNSNSSLTNRPNAPINVERSLEDENGSHDLIEKRGLIYVYELLDPEVPSQPMMIP